jgi:hypothetical protein
LHRRHRRRRRHRNAADAAPDQLGQIRDAVTVRVDEGCRVFDSTNVHQVGVLSVTARTAKTTQIRLAMRNTFSSIVRSSGSITSMLRANNYCSPDVAPAFVSATRS